VPASLVQPGRSRARRAVVLAAAAGLVAAPLTLAASLPAAAAGSTGLVISEVYGGGGNSGATLTHDFVELYNPTDEPIDLTGMSLQYRSGSSTGGLGGAFSLAGSVAPGTHYLVQGAQGTGGTQALPTPDAESTLGLGGSSGVVVLADTTDTVEIPLGDAAGTPGVVDLVGYDAQRFEGQSGPRLSSTTSAARDADGTDTDDNAADFTAGPPTPEASGSDGGDPEPPAGPQELAIAEIQGTGDTSPYEGQDVVTEGVVTAAYPTGGFNAFVIQTPGAEPGEASHGLYVYGRTATSGVEVGDHVRVRAEVAEYRGLTELTSVESVEQLEEPATVEPAEVAWPATDAGRERLESMLVMPTGPFTVTNNYVTNRYAEIGLAAGTDPLRQPTDVAPYGSPEAAAQAAENAAELVTLDDGASIDFLPRGGGSNQDIPLPWLTEDPTIRVGEAATFVNPVVVDYRFDLWRFQPTAQLTADDENDVLPATFGDTRTPAPAETHGDVTVASFNVLNYFPTLGEELEGCDYYVDRDEDPVTVSGGCLARGAAEEEDFARQQAKIVRAVNALDADVVSLEEIENSRFFGQDRDAALARLVDALNADLGTEAWSYVRSPGEVPAADREDVIRTGFIYRREAVKPQGPSVIDDSPEFDNARDPLGQVFKPARGRGGDRFLLVVNHFKSKGSAPGGDDPNADRGQGAWNVARTAQAEALVRFADDLKERFDVAKVYLDGDFNSYTFEDPMLVLRDAGYVNLAQEFGAAPTYQFDGQVGSLDHALANEAALGTTTGATVWNVNSPEAVALEYSRHNYNATIFFEASEPFRASDHDPIVFGIDSSR
jgi:5'-nucleotidase